MSGGPALAGHGILENMFAEVGAQMPVTIAVTVAGKEAVDALMREHEERQAATARAYARRHRLDELEGPAAAAVKAAIRDRANERRTRRILLDRLDPLVSEAVARELERRDIDPHAPQPEIERGADLPGRWLGAVNPGYPERISALIPAVFVLAARAEAWRISAPWIRALREWAKAHPEWNGFRRGRHRRRRLPRGTGPADRPRRRRRAAQPRGRLSPLRSPAG
jgi:hypothetical protein